MERVQKVTREASEAIRAAVLPDAGRAQLDRRELDEAPAHRAPHRLHLPRRRLGVVQRGADAAGLDRQPVRAHLVARHRSVDVRQLSTSTTSARASRAFDVLSPHTELTITARSLVEVRPRPLEHVDVTWERSRRESARDRSRPSSSWRRPAARGRIPTSRSSPARSRSRARSPRRGPRTRSRSPIGDAVEYMHGITGVHSTAHEAWEAAQGRLPGHRAHHARRAARRRHPGPLRVGLPAPAPERRGRRARHRRVARVGGVVRGRLAGLRPDEQHRDRRPPRARRVAAATTAMCRRCAACTPGPFKSHLHVKVTITREA